MFVLKMIYCSTWRYHIRQFHTVTPSVRCKQCQWYYNRFIDYDVVQAELGSNLPLLFLKRFG